jgi:hypothetical protein
MRQRVARVCGFALLVAFAAYGQSDWPTSFDGVTAMGPYQWVDGPTAIAQGKLANAVVGGSEGSTTLYICRVPQSDGVHPGKAFNGLCNIGWGGVEVSKSSGYELLINTRPELAKYLAVNWINSGVAGGFIGGKAGSTNLPVCHAAYTNGWHPGKEWAGKCNIGYGGKEVAEGVYQDLQLAFNKAQWTSDNSTIIVSGLPTNYTPNPNNIDFNTQPSTASISSTATNGIFMKLKGGGACYGARVAPLVPKDAGMVGAGTAFGQISSPQANCFDDPRSWLTRDIVGVQDGVTPWFRIRFFANQNVCLQPTSAAESAPINFVQCASTDLQWWTIGTYDNGDVGLVNAGGASIVLGQPAAPPNFTMLYMPATSVAIDKFKFRDNGYGILAKASHVPLAVEVLGSWKYDPYKVGRILP